MSTLLLLVSLSLPTDTQEKNDDNLRDLAKTSLFSNLILHEISQDLNIQHQALVEKVNIENLTGIAYQDTMSLLTAVK